MEFISERAVGLSTSPSLTDLPGSRTLAGFMRLSASRRSAPSALRHTAPDRERCVLSFIKSGASER